MRRLFLACLAMLGASIGAGIALFPAAAEARPVCLTNDMGEEASSAGYVCFAIAQDNTLWRNVYSDLRGGWAGWRPLGGIVQGDINCIGTRRKDCFGRGTDNAIYQRVLPSTGGEWSSLGGAFFGSPTCVNSPRGFECFARGTDNALWRNSGRIGHGWSGWTSAGGILAGDPECVISRTGTVDCMVRNTEGAMSHIACAPERPCAGWANLDGVLNSRISCVLEEEGASPAFSPFTCFVLGADNTLFSKTYTGTWGPWTRVSDQALAGDPECVASGGGTVTCFARDSRNYLTSNRRTAGVWGGWRSAGNIVLSGSPGCLHRPRSNQIHCAARSASGRMAVTTLAPDTFPVTQEIGIFTIRE